MAKHHHHGAQPFDGDVLFHSHPGKDWDHKHSLTNIHTKYGEQTTALFGFPCFDDHRTAFGQWEAS